MLMLTDIVAASREVAATRSRLKKIALFAGVLQRLEAAELPAAVGFLCGELRQGRLGLGPSVSGASTAIQRLGQVT